MLVGAFCFSLCFGTQEIQSNIDPQFKVLVKESFYLPDTLSGMCPAAWGDKRRRTWGNCIYGVFTERRSPIKHRQKVSDKGLESKAWRRREISHWRKWKQSQEIVDSISGVSELKSANPGVASLAGLRCGVPSSTLQQKFHKLFIHYASMASIYHKYKLAQ